MERDDLLNAEFFRGEISYPFIEADTEPVTLNELQEDHIVLGFKDESQPPISHVAFVEATKEAVSSFYHGENILEPKIRVSHPVKGRVPDSKNKANDALIPFDKTLYYERMMFVIEIPSITDIIDGNLLSLTVGGVTFYNKDNLFTRNECAQNFKLFIGFQNKVCTNMCVSTDGFMSDVRFKQIGSLQMHIQHLLRRYQIKMHLEAMKELVNYTLTEEQFVQFIGKCRMQQHLPSYEKASINEILFDDQQLGKVVRDYYRDRSFCRQPDGSISLWKLYNLLTGANKSTDVDQFLNRSVNAFEVVEQLRWALTGYQKSWYFQ